MEIDEVFVKDNPGLCRCCLSEGCYKDLASNYAWMGDTEIYADMLLECFDISISQQVEGPNGLTRLICEVCITRLRDACNFKKQVVESENKFIDMIGRGEFRQKVYETSITKQEVTFETEETDGTEPEYLHGADYTEPDEDDEVLANLATTSRPQETPKRSRGRPKKTTGKTTPSKTKVKAEKKKVVKEEGKKARDVPACQRVRTARTRRDNLCLLFNHTSLLPFKWRGRYLCFYCGKDFTLYSDLRDHTKTHGKCNAKDYALKIVKGSHIEIKVDVSEIVCELCSESFDGLKEVIEHLKLVHELPYDSNIEVFIEEYRLRDLTCLVCQEKFTFFGYLVSHMNNAHPKNAFVCDDCGLTFNKKRDLAVHIRNLHKPGGYNCKVCLKSFESLSLLKTHKYAEHLVRCKHCGLNFTSLPFLRKHKVIEHFDSGNTCRHCNKICHSKIGLQQHIPKCKVGKLLNEKKSSFYTESNIEPKVKQNCKQIRENITTVLNMSTAIPFKFFNKFSCFFCNVKFVEFKTLKEHTLTQHPTCDVNSKSIRRCKGERVNVKIDVTLLSCSVCGVRLDLESLIDHLIKDHNAKYDKAYACFQAYEVSSDSIPCPKCPNLKFRYFSILLKHMNAKHTNNSIICSFCGQTFGKLANLRAHVSNNHTRSTSCNLCESVFKNTSALARHNAKHHNAKDYKCTLCDDEFASQYKRQKHMILIHNSGHKCNFCDRMFTRNSFMIDHMRRTHYKEKNVQCSVCSEKFFDNYLLRMHMVKHDGERKFHCDVCGKSFLRRSNLSGHMDVHKKQAMLQGIRQER